MHLPLHNILFYPGQTKYNGYILYIYNNIIIYKSNQSSLNVNTNESIVAVAPINIPNTHTHKWIILFYFLSSFHFNLIHIIKGNANYNDPPAKPPIRESNTANSGILKANPAISNTYNDLKTVLRIIYPYLFLFT